MPRDPELIYDVKDNKMMMKRAIKGAFYAVISILIINYLIFCLEDDSLLSRAEIFQYYAHGSVFNDIVGLWAVSFTPITSLEVVAPAWVEDVIIYLAPALVAGLFMAVNVKSVKWAPVAGLFFVMWGILLPMIFVLIFPLFSIVDPTAINASLISAFSDVYTNFNAFYSGIIGLVDSIFLGWCISGTLELAGIATVISLPLALLFNVLNNLFSR